MKPYHSRVTMMLTVVNYLISIDAGNSFIADEIIDMLDDYELLDVWFNVCTLASVMTDRVAAAELIVTAIHKNLDTKLKIA